MLECEGISTALSLQLSTFKVLPKALCYDTGVTWASISFAGALGNED